LVDARRGLLEAEPSMKPGRANTALCLAIATVIDELGPGPRAETGTSGMSAEDTTGHEFDLNGKSYAFTSLEFPEYPEVMAAVSRQIRSAERREDPIDPVSLDPALERQIIFRVDQALGFIK
jgi:hypothetical protein